MTVKIRLAESYDALGTEQAPGKDYPLLLHQEQTLEKLEGNQLVINTHNTGSGKTLAALLYLQRIKGGNVLYIAPTNELINQQATAVKEFIKDTDLDYNVIKIDAEKVSKIAKSLDKPMRRADILIQVLQNPTQFAEVLEISTNGPKMPYVLVTNPDIFYYILYFRYGKLDRQVLCAEMLITFKYIIIDEFHYYNSKQLSNFLYFFAISKAFGYFNEDEGHRICLLSATPSKEILEYLDKLGIKKAIVHCKADKGNTTQILTKANLYIKPMPQKTLRRAHLLHDSLMEYDDKIKDVAAISNSLSVINHAYSLFEDKSEVGRIIGPQDEEARKIDMLKRTTLATPTVDLGHEFFKKYKARQNLDLLVLEAQTEDELIQRSGRAGRVLGKLTKDVPSDIVAFVPPKAYMLFKKYFREENEELSREEFFGIARKKQIMPQKKTFSQYISSYAILESFYPLYQLYEGSTVDIQEKVLEFFNIIQRVFNTNHTYDSLAADIEKYDKRKQVVKGERKISEQDIKDYATWMGEGPLSELEAKQGLTMKKCISETMRFVEQQYSLVDSLFNFRDSFSGPQAAIYDPKELLSSTKIARYDILRLAQSFDFNIIKDKKTFENLANAKVEAAEFYIKLLDYTKPRPIAFHLTDSEITQEDFEEKYCFRPASFTDLFVEHKDRGHIDMQIAAHFKSQFVTMLVVPDKYEGLLRKILQNTKIYPYKLTFRGLTYHAVVGTSAFLIYPELIKRLTKKDCQRYPVII